MSNLIPYFISENYKLGKFKGKFKAYSMFVDISGFTELTETLMRYKKSGSEILANIVNNLFKPLVEEVYNNGGIITNFEGDAFTAVFKNEKEYNKVLDTALFIIKHLEVKNKNKSISDSIKYEQINIHVKIGLSFGLVKWGIVGSGDRNMYYFRGEAIEGCTKSEHYSDMDEIVIDNLFLERLNSNDRKSVKAIKFKGQSKDKIQYYVFNSNIKYNFRNNNKNIQKKNLLEKDDLSPFISKSIYNIGNKAEFKEIVSVFLSFKEPKSDTQLKKITSFIIEESDKYGGYSRLDFGDKGFNFLILFGAPKSFENNIERALEFVLKLSQNLDVTFRSGITYGTVYAGIIGGKERGEYSAIGNVINLSARFMIKAKWGEFLVDKYISDNQKNNFSFKKLGSFSFKGITDNTSTFKFLGKNDDLKESFNDDQFIGRLKELKQLVNYSKPIFGKKLAGVTYILGEAGIGKSRLILEFRKDLAGSISWINMPCEEILRKSFNPVIYFLKKYFLVSEGDNRKDNKLNFEKKIEDLITSLKKIRNNSEVKEIIIELERTKSIIGGYIGIIWRNSIFSQLDAKSRYENFLYAIKNLIKGLSLIRPIIIEIDDTHLIDSDSKKFFNILLRNIDNFPIFIICSSRYKDDENIHNNQNNSILDIEEGISTNSIELGFMNKSEIGKYGKVILETKHGFSTKFLSLIKEKTNGNPFFIEQLLLELKEKKLITSKMIKVKNRSSKIDYQLSIDEKELLNVPSTLQAIIASKIDRLPNELKEIVQTASVLGRKFLIEILIDILDDKFNRINDNNIASKRYGERLKSIEEKNIWILLSKMSYLFKQAMLRDSAYDMQLRSVLKEKHKSIAISYEKRFKKSLKEYYSEIAFHYVKGGEKKGAVKYLRKAGDFAKENYENEKALDYYNTLLSEYKLSSKMIIDTNLKKAEILKLTGELNIAMNILKDIYITAREINDKNRIQRILSLTGSLFYNTGKLDKAMKTFEKQLEICEEIDDKKGIAKVLGNIGVLHYSTGNYSKGIDYQKRKLAICLSINDEKGIASVYGNLGNIYGEQNNNSEQLNYYENSLKISNKLNDKLGISNALSSLGIFYKDRGDSSKAMEFYTKRLKLCNELGDKIGLALTYGNIGIVFSENGDYSKAMKYYNEYLAISNELGDKHGKSIVLVNIGNVYEKQGLYSKALNSHLNALKLKENLKNKRGISLTLGNIANVYSLMKEYISAIESYNRSIEIDIELNLVHFLIYHLSDKANCLFLMGEFKEAEKVNNEVLIKAIETKIEDKILVSKKLEKKIKSAILKMEKK